MTTRLSELVFKDYADINERLELINSTIAEFTSSLPSADSYSAAKHGNLTGPLREAIDRTFKFDNIDEILDALRKETESSDEFLAEWAKATQKTIAIRSPTSLHVTLRQLREGRQWNISETFIREHKIASAFMAHPDFIEGVSARLINKPPTKPQWQPAKIEDVTAADVDKFFEELGPNEGLQLVEPHQDALDQRYTDYPHAKFALPRESDIQKVVQQVGKEGSKRVIDDMVKQWKSKPGVREKVQDVIVRKTVAMKDGKGIKWKTDSHARL